MKSAKGETGAPKRPRLLIVDDEVRILAALERSLRREGYEIRCTDSPIEAIELVEDQAIDVVLSDQKMPGMSGLELIARVVERRPEAACILITGWTEDVPMAEVERLGVHALLPKPWDDGELKRALRGAVEALRAS